VNQLFYHGGILLVNNMIEDCGKCYECLKSKTIKMRFKDDSYYDMPIVNTRMILCVECGNKRCPHATDHRFTCTGSNEPGQIGSRY